jgi:hypothetical protein
MKIDESCIDHNTVRIIRDLIDTRYELIDNDKPAQERGYTLMTLGEIAGVIEMTEAVKEVLRA